MIIEYFYSHKSSPLYFISRSATVAAMVESVSRLCGESDAQRFRMLLISLDPVLG